MTDEPDRPDRSEPDLLHERALELAHSVTVGPDATDGQEVLAFSIGDVVYALNTDCVSEVVRFSRLTQLPGLPDFCVGIVGVRGRIVSVIDLLALFAAGRCAADAGTAIVLSNGSMEFAILAEKIVGVRTVAPSELQSSIPTLTPEHEAFLTGVTQDRVVLLDGLRLLEHPGMVVDQTGLPS